MSIANKHLSAGDIVAGPRVGRRSALSAVGLGIAGLAVVRAGSASAQPLPCSDHDASDPSGRGRHCAVDGCIDSDPTDPAGHGRHCGARSGCSDSDPTDAPGNGHHC